MKPQIINSKMNRLLLQSKIVKLAIFMAVVMTAVLLTGSLYFRSTVYITDNGVTREIRTNESDIYAILREENYTLNPNDTVVFTKDEETNSGYIEIHRAFDVSITADGETFTVEAAEGTVADALEKAGIKLGKYDVVDTALETEIFPGIEIKVTRIVYVNREEQSEIAFATEIIENSNHAIGYEETLTEGQNGVRTVYYKDTYVDGKRTATEQLSEKVTVEPVKEVIEVGTAVAVPYAKMDDPTALKLENGIPANYTRIVSGKATAYSAKPGAKTASGRYAVVGTVAVNPNVIPYGSELYIVSQDRKIVYGYAIAADTGLGMMEGTVAVDVFMGSYADSCKWGAHYVDIYVLSEGHG